MESFLFVQAYNKMVEAMDVFTDSLATSHDAFCANAAGPFVSGEAAIHMASSIYKSKFYSDEQEDGRETPVCYGAIAVSQDVIDKAKRVNEAKDSLRLVSNQLASSLKPQKGSGSLSKSARAKALRARLNEMGYGRLSLKQCNRHIPYVELSPISIRFSYTSEPKSITKITAAQALKELEEKGFEDSKAEIDARVLRALPSNHELAKVQYLPGVYKVNMTLEEGETVKPIKVYLPILHLGGAVERQEDLPASIEHERAKRSDRKICDEPLASSIRVYDYLK